MNNIRFIGIEFSRKKIIVLTNNEKLFLWLRLIIV